MQRFTHETNAVQYATNLLVLQPSIDLFSAKETFHVEKHVPGFSQFSNLLHPHFMKMGYKEGDFPVAEEMSKRVISLPVHPFLSKEDILNIISAVKGAV